MYVFSFIFFGYILLLIVWFIVKEKMLLKKNGRKVNVEEVLVDVVEGLFEV